MFAHLLDYAFPIGALALLGCGAWAFLYVPIVGRQVAVGFVVAAAATFAFGEGYQVRGGFDKSATLQGEIAGLKANVAEKQRQADAANVLAAESAKAERDAEGRAAANQQKVDDYVAELAKRSTPACGLSDDDVERLRAIGGTDAAPTQPAAGAADVRPAGSGSGTP